MPYGIDPAVWVRLPADDQAAIRAGYEGAQGSASGGNTPPPGPVPSPPPPPPVPSPPPPAPAAAAPIDYAALVAAIRATPAGQSQPIPAGVDWALLDAALGIPTPEQINAAIQAIIDAPLPPAATGDGLDSLDNDPDAEAGPEPTDADYQLYSAEADAIAAGQPVELAVSHPAPGTLIGTPYVGSHAVAFNRAGGSDNWQSENADDVWLYPGTAITAVADGQISPGGYGYGLSSSGGRFAGWRLHLITANGRAFFYTHLSSLAVPKDAHVVAGQLIGRSGIANGVPHLHFAARPPFSPTAFYRAAFSLKDRNPIADPVIGGVGVQGGLPNFDLSDAGVRTAWNDLMAVLGRTLPAAASHVRDARAALDSAVS